MTNHEPVEINGTEYAPVVARCPGDVGDEEYAPCGAEIDAQRALIEGCPHCGHGPKALVHATEPSDPPADYEPESYKVQA